MPLCRTCDKTDVDIFSIYLIDHAWTFRRQTARQQLQSHPGLAERMAALLDMTWQEDDRENIIDVILVRLNAFIEQRVNLITNESFTLLIILLLIWL